MTGGAGATADSVPEDSVGAAEASARLLERMATRLGGIASAATAFGTPIVSEGLTVVPVARAGFGFGGGAGREVRTDGTGEGGGGGGGVDVRPLGYLEIRSGTVRYRPIRDPWRDVAIPLTSLVLATAAPKLLRGIARLRHGRRG
ncbi:spore germination protein GerW family protein [Nocardia wallacei]|uniref:spore germination protein GerW family protein n=1 Tax=Nocardia wallacei TaxID=480035 RepID=UPI00245668A9|nr:spore germination protein GerW family protein [Nocardia wallacei]